MTMRILRWIIQNTKGTPPPLPYPPPTPTPPLALQLETLKQERTSRETERGGTCRPIATEVNRDSGSTYDRVSFLGYALRCVTAYSSGNRLAPLWG